VCVCGCCVALLIYVCVFVFVRMHGNIKRLLRLFFWDYALQVFVYVAGAKECTIVLRVA